jgi:hypothetical protein
MPVLWSRAIGADVMKRIAAPRNDLSPATAARARD